MISQNCFRFCFLSFPFIFSFLSSLLLSIFSLSILDKCNVYKLMSFNICIHMWNHHPSQDNDLSITPRTFSCSFVIPLTHSFPPNFQGSVFHVLMYCFAFPWALYKVIQYATFYWLLSLSKIILNFIHILVCINN